MHAGGGGHTLCIPLLPSAKEDVMIYKYKFSAIAVALVVSLSVMFVISESTATTTLEDTWLDEGNYDWKSWYNSDTYESTTEYEITTAAQLAGLAYLVNENDVHFEGKTILLPENGEIDLADHLWIPIGKFESPSTMSYFEGDFNGNDCTISNLITDNSSGEYSYTGLFGQIGPFSDGSPVEISNVNLTDIYIHSSGFIGGLVTITYVPLTISNCTVSGTIEISSGNYSYAAGILGKSTISNGEGGIEISNCVNNTNIISSKSVTLSSGVSAGIVGSSDTVSLKITSCTNNGNVIGVNSVGGIVSSINNGVIESCTNTGTINGSTYEGQTNAELGGIVGSARAGSSSSSSVEIKNCTNSGTVTTTSANVVTGGIIGIQLGATISNCINQGKITGTDSVGGIVGSLEPMSEIGTISDCSNSGSVSGNGNVGGIAGESMSYSQSPEPGYVLGIKNCSNSGTISGTTSATTGGIIGTNNSGSQSGVPVVISGCLNTGTVPSESGPIAGTNNEIGSSISIEYCFWPESQGSYPVSSGAGSDSSSSSTVVNNSAYNEDGSLTSEVTDENNNKLTSVSEAIENLFDESTQIPDSLSVSASYVSDIGNTPGEATVAFGTTITLPTLTSDGYIFVGWNHGGKTYTAGSTFIVTSDVEFTAVWEAIIGTPSVSIEGSHDAYTGQSIVLTANVSGSSGDMTYVWYKDGVEITGATGSTCTVDETGTYTVKVDVTSGTQTATATSVDFNVTFHEWVIEDTMTLYPNFDPFEYTFDYPVTVTGISYTDASDGSDRVVKIDGKKIEYVDPGTAHLTVAVEGLPSIALTITILSDTSTVTTEDGTNNPVVEIPSETTETTIREDISASISENEIDVPQDVIQNANIVDIYVPDNEGKPIQESDIRLTIPYSMFGVGITYDNHGNFEFYVIHYHNGSAVLISTLEFGLDGVSFTVKGFSPFMLGAKQTVVPEPEPEYPPFNPGWNDDDYVPLPPVIVHEPSENNDDTTTTVACAAAAVVAAIMAVFLIMEYRKK